MFISLRSPTEDEKISVMPAWIAGIQARRMRPETSMSNLMGSGTPCRNDDNGEDPPKLTQFSVASSRTPKNVVILRATTNMLVLVFAYEDPVAKFVDHAVKLRGILTT